MSGDRLKLLPVLGAVVGMPFAIVPFALSFPRNSMARWPWWLHALGLLAVLAWLSYVVTTIDIVPFRVDKWSSGSLLFYAAVVIISVVIAMAILLRSYRRSIGDDRARLKWAVLGLSAVLTVQSIGYVFLALPYQLAGNLSGRGATPKHWLVGLVYGFLWPLAMGNAILRQRVIDAQFAVSRTLVYGTVSTLALAIVAAVHWLLGRVIEHSGLALGLEGAAAIGLGLVLHRGTHAINGLVDRVVFRKHHAAEERLRRVTAALPYAVSEGSIAEALVLEPVRNLDLASAALFYRESSEGPLRRVLAQGWNEAHAASLEADSLLVRYLQAEHEPLKLNDSHLLPAAVPEGAALPVLAVPIVNQHALVAVVLYGSNVNHTLLDPDEIELLHQLAKAAATAHQQVGIAMLQREVAALTTENSALTRENSAEKARNNQLDTSLAELRALVRERTTRGT